MLCSQVDFADVRSVMTDAGPALMGIGRGFGKGRARDAALAAVSSPLLDFPIERARGVVFTITGNADMSLGEVNEVASVISEIVSDDANIIFGTSVDDTFDVCAVTEGEASRSGARALLVLARTGLACSSSLAHPYYPQGELPLAPHHAALRRWHLCRAQDEIAVTVVATSFDTSAGAPSSQSEDAYRSSAAEPPQTATYAEWQAPQQTERKRGFWKRF